MRKFCLLMALLVLLSMFTGCTPSGEAAQLAATTLPAYEFTLRLCSGTGITVTRLVTENVSCLHDYSLNVRQVRAAESAQAIVISGAGLEDFMHEMLEGKHCIDGSGNMELLCGTHHHHEEDSHGHDHGHSHDTDPHYWLSPAHAKIMAENICRELVALYPDHADIFRSNLVSLLADLDALQAYGEETLADLASREIITFHDGFAYLAQCYGLTVLAAVEEESGSEASAKELIRLIRLVQEHALPAVFIETNGADSAARIIADATDARIYSLDMAMSGDSWFESMYRNIDTLKEALG